MSNWIDHTVLVTGGSGSLGSPVVRALARDGVRVRVLDDHSRGPAERLADLANDVELIVGDIRDREAVDAATRGVTAVIHLAYINGTAAFYERPTEVLDVAVKGIVNVIDACVANGVSELFAASSSEVYQTPPSIPTPENVPLVVPDPLNPRFSYGGGKILVELMALNYGRAFFERVVVFRPHNVYGPDMGRDHVIPELIEKISEAGARGDASVTLQGDGSQTRAFLFIDDFVRGLTTLVERGEHLNIYNIGSEEEVTIGELAELIRGELDSGVRFEPGAPLAGATSRRCPDVSKLAAIGFTPAVPLAEGLARTVQWYRTRTSSA